MTRQKLFPVLAFAFCLLCFADSLDACSPLPNYKYATIDEEASNAGAVIRGTVEKIIGGDQINDSTVVLSVDKYLKGCGQDSVVVSGFQGSSLCGSGIPDVGDELIVFVCLDRLRKNERGRSRQRWKLNTYDIFTGVWFVKYIRNRTSHVEQYITDELKLDNQPGDCASLGACGKGAHDDRSHDKSECSWDSSESGSS